MPDTFILSQVSHTALRRYGAGYTAAGHSLLSFLFTLYVTLTPLYTACTYLHRTR